MTKHELNCIISNAGFQTWSVTDTDPPGSHDVVAWTFDGIEFKLHVSENDTKVQVLLAFLHLSQQLLTTSLEHYGPP